MNPYMLGMMGLNTALGYIMPSIDFERNRQLAEEYYGRDLSRINQANNMLWNMRNVINPGTMNMQSGLPGQFTFGGQTFSPGGMAQAGVPYGAQGTPSGNLIGGGTTAGGYPSEFQQGWQQLGAAMMGDQYIPQPSAGFSEQYMAAHPEHFGPGGDLVSGGGGQSGSFTPEQIAGFEANRPQGTVNPGADSADFAKRYQKAISQGLDPNSAEFSQAMYPEQADKFSAGPGGQTAQSPMGGGMNLNSIFANPINFMDQAGLSNEMLYGGLQSALSRIGGAQGDVTGAAQGAVASGQGYMDQFGNRVAGAMRGVDTAQNQMNQNIQKGIRQLGLGMQRFRGDMVADPTGAAIEGTSRIYDPLRERLETEFEKTRTARLGDISDVSRGRAGQAGADYARNLAAGMTPAEADAARRQQMYQGGIASAREAQGLESEIEQLRAQTELGMAQQQGTAATNTANLQRQLNLALRQGDVATATNIANMFQQGGMAQLGSEMSQAGLGIGAGGTMLGAGLQLGAYPMQGALANLNAAMGGAGMEYGAGGQAGQMGMTGAQLAGQFTDMDQAQAAQMYQFLTGQMGQNALFSNQLQAQIPLVMHGALAGMNPPNVFGTPLTAGVQNAQSGLSTMANYQLAANPPGQKGSFGMGLTVAGYGASGQSGCIDGNSWLISRTGPIRLADVRFGAEVLGEDGNYHKVIGKDYGTDDEKPELVQIVGRDGEFLRATPEHKIGGTAAKDLRVGDKINHVIIKGIGRQDYVPSGDIMIDGNKRYIANGFAVDSQIGEFGLSNWRKRLEELGSKTENGCQRQVDNPLDVFAIAEGE